ncbi:MAG: terminase family protein [Pseudomonadota bacterium]
MKDYIPPVGPLRWLDWAIDPAAADEKARAHLDETPFLATARGSQRPPPGHWRTWLFMAGRGAGKTRAGAEWARFAALKAGLGRLALVGPTLSDAREVMIEGPSGLKAASQYAEEELPVYQVSRRRLEWPNGALGFIFSAEDPDSLRGPQFDGAWCDEAAAWKRGPMVWDMLQMALRIGDSPRAVVTTTPKPVPLIKRLVASRSTVVTRGATSDNADFLSPTFLEEVTAAYGDTLLGKQELEGLLIESQEGALWTATMLRAVALSAAPPRFDDVVVAVDPPVSQGRSADECGIIAVGAARGDRGPVVCYVLDDASARGLSPIDWAGRAVALAKKVGASRVVAEVNQGGDMVAQTFEAAGCQIPVEARRAVLSKRARAIPVVALYQKGLIHHVGRFDALEQQMLLFGTDSQKGSPDRVDALVWGVTSLALDHAGDPRVRRM